MKNPFLSLIEFSGLKKLGNILLKMNAISEDNLEKAVIIKEQNPNKLLGEIIIEKGFSTQENVNLALDEQRKESRLGALLIKSGLLKQEQLTDALNIQKETNEKLGDILIKKGYSNPKQIENALKFQKRDNRLGTLLISNGLINEFQLEEAIKEQERKSGLLGEILISMKFITSEELTSVLLKQSRTK
jgi:hypothetical protein